MEDRLGILIVEDDLLQSMMLEKLVVTLNQDVLGTTRYGENAVELANELNPDVIFMDIALAGKLNGIETVQRLNKITDASIVYITGNTWAANHESLNKTTYKDILVKPITLADIQAILSEI